MALPNGMSQRFSVATGRVISVTSSTGNTITTESRKARVQVSRNDAGRLESVYSQAQGLMRCLYSPNRLTVEWYSPQAVTAADHGYATTGDPYKTTLYETWLEQKPAQEGDIPDKVPAAVTRITTSRPGQSPQVTLRQESPGRVTITRGEGDERIVRTITAGPITDGRWERIETVQGINDSKPVSCTRSVKKHTPGGWLDISRTEQYGTPLSKTTLCIFNAGYRISLDIKPNGGYTRYEYDGKQRVILVATPWAGGGERAMQTTYADHLFNDHRPAVQEELILSENGDRTVLKRKEYTYENTEQCSRTSVRETALGSGHVHTSVTEIWGPQAPCPYARGRNKYSRGIDGVETIHDYEETADHGAAYRLTTTTRANGTVVPGQSARSVDYIAANGLTLRSERYAHTGQAWSLLSREDYIYDAEKRLLQTTHGNGRTSRTEWMCCGPLRKTDEDGIVTSYGYNSSRQLVETIRSATETTPEIIVSYTRDAAGRTLSTRTDAGPMTTITHTAYDTLGRMASSTDILGRITTHAYSEDGLSTTVTTPTGATFEEKRHYDGTVLHHGGTGRRAVETRLSITPEGILTTTLSRGVVLSRTCANGFGQTILQEQPDTRGGFIRTENHYNDRRQLIRTRTENQAPTVMEYDVMGGQARQTFLLDETQPDNPLCNRISEQRSCYRSMKGGVYQIQTQTTYSAQGRPLVQTNASLVSRLDSVLESRTVTTNPYGQRSEQRVHYAGAARRIRYSHVPESNTAARTVLVDGFAVSQTSHAGQVSRQTRTHTAEGMVLRQTDPRGNTTVTQSDIAGRTVKTTDAMGNATTIAYGLCCDNPVTIIDAKAGVTCYSYDVRGRKTAEYGAAALPACFAYDDADNMVRLTTFRANEGDITANPEERSDGDVTTWAYDAATGLELVKTYADGSQVTKTYDALNRLATLTKARGIVTTHSYAPLTGELIAVTHSDETEGRRFTYNHLGQLTAVADASGARKITHDAHGQVQRETVFGGRINAFITEHHDDLGRSAGYSLGMNHAITQQTALHYDDKGRPSSMTVDGNDQTFTWGYDTAGGFINRLAYPNGMVRQDACLPARDLVASIEYRRATDASLLAGHTYSYDALGRPVSRQDDFGMNETPQTHGFTYNARSELTGDLLGTGEHNGTYAYDNIGNRKTARESKRTITYEANRLNQYSRISSAMPDAPPSTPTEFTPAFDPDGNQTRLLTSTGIWTVQYDANDRPVALTSEDGSTVVTCGYDYMGRRFEKKTTVDGTISTHEYYLYRGVLQIAQLDMTMHRPKLMRSYVWDPTQPAATRLLGMKLHANDHGPGSKHLYYMYDAMKNVTSIVNEKCIEQARYTYYPFGGIKTMRGDLAQENKFRFSCEFMDDETGLVYYNYRHLNPKDGRWINRDLIAENGGRNIYSFIANQFGIKTDRLGLSWEITRDPEKPKAIACTEDGSPWEELAQIVHLEPREADKWVTGHEVPPKPCKNYEIPNTIIQAWYGDVFWVGKRYSGWDFDPGGNYHIKQLSYSPCSKDEIENSVGNLAKEDSIYSRLYGVYIYGHGNQTGVTWGGKGSLKPNEDKKTDDDKKRYKNPYIWTYKTDLNYKLAMVNFRACETDRAKKYCASNGLVCDVFDGIYIPMPISWGFTWPRCLEWVFELF